MKTKAEQQCELYEAALQALCNNVQVYTESGDNVSLDLDAIGTEPGGSATLRAEAILKRVTAGEKLSAIAAEERLAFKVTPPFDRTGQDGRLGAVRVLVAKLFASKPGEAVIGETAGGAIVARLTEVKPAQPSADKKTVDATRDSLRQGIASDLLEQLTGALRQRYAVEIKRKTIEARF